MLVLWGEGGYGLFKSSTGRIIVRPFLNKPSVFASFVERRCVAGFYFQSILDRFYKCW